MSNYTPLKSGRLWPDWVTEINNHFLLKADPSLLEIIRAAYANEGYIAGGAACYFAGMTTECNDIDIFFKAEDNLYQACEDIRQFLKGNTQGLAHFTHDWSLSIDKFSLNWIRFGIPEDVIKTFDIRLSKFYLRPGTSDRLEIVNYTATYPDPVDPNLKPDELPRTYQRILKYLNRTKTSQAQAMMTETLDAFLRRYQGCSSYILGIPQASYSILNGAKVIAANVNSILAGAPASQFTPFGISHGGNSLPSKSNKTVPDGCPHKNIGHYQGLMNEYDYCKDCGEKL